MNYDEALKYIHNTHKFGIKLGLDNISMLLSLMGDPHKKLKYVHVAGTNGKGSTVALISSILIEAGLKVGIYTSPYIERFTERIKINDREISAEDLAKVTDFVKAKVDVLVGRGEKHPTEFEIVTAAAFRYFYENGCDIVVLEVGLGGRFDSTNVIDTPLAAVITTISYDHMDRLGNTLSEIAFEKAGIIKYSGDVVLYPQADEAEAVFSKVSRERHSVLHRVELQSLVSTGFDIDGQTFHYKGLKDLKISLLGEHQIKNAAVALETIEVLKTKGFDIGDTAVRQGLKKARWPGRLEVLSRDPVFIIDGAHNAEGAGVLMKSLKKYFPGKRYIFILGTLRDKDYKAIIGTVLPEAYSCITVTPDSERALPAEELAAFARPYCINVSVSDTIEGAIRKSLQTSSSNDIICAFGSLYYIGEVRAYFNSGNR